MLQWHFWSDANMRGFQDACEAMQIELIPVGLYDFQVPLEHQQLAHEWGATIVEASTDA